MVATRAAVPSGRRKWSLPDHDGNTMPVVFPFIYQPTLAVGAMCYLFEYFSGFVEESIGDQIASLEQCEKGADAHGRDTYALTYSVALAPFDLGVTQSVLFTTCYDEAVKSYCIHMTVTRRSGPEMNWVTTNKPFLEKLRKLLIRWRNIDGTQRRWYMEEGHRLFATGPGYVVGPRPAESEPDPSGTDEEPEAT
jgi:hypothetical protein